MLDVGLVELSMGEYDLIKVMPTKKNLFLTIEFIIICVETNICSKNKYTWTSMSSLYQKKFSMPLGKSRCLTFWIYVLVTISCHWKKVTKLRQHSRGLILMGNIICINDSFSHLVWRTPLQNLKSHGWGFGYLHQMLH